MGRRFGLALILWAALSMKAQAPSYPPQTPFLRIETGMHTAPIRRIDVDAAERFLVTASDDKTARVWDLHDGRLLQVLRPPQGTGSEGMLFAVAISPDGKTVVVGGYTGHNAAYSLYFFDRASATLLRNISGLPNEALHLAYSLDGRYMVVALGGSNGIRVYGAADYNEVATDAHYGDKCSWAEFDKAGRLVTASDDGFVRLYDAGFQLIAKKSAPGGKQPVSARFSPDDTEVAVGFYDSTAVSVLSGADLSFLYAPTTPSGDGNLSAVAWSRDGRTLYAGGMLRVGLGLIEMVSWSRRNAKPDYQPVSANAITAIRALSRGRIVVGSADPAVGVVDADGRFAWQHAPETLNFGRLDAELRVASDGGTVEFGFLEYRQGWQGHVGRFDLARRQISLNVNRDASLAEARTDGLNIEDWHNTHHPALAGRALSLAPYEMSRSLAISADRSQFLLGADWYLRLFNADGTQKWETQTPGAAWVVNLTGDGRYAVAALGDGTIRWYRVDDGREVMGLFVDPDGKRWVLWTPEGFYDSSADADSLIGYHINHGPDQTGEFVRVEQLKKLFYRPELLAQRLKPGGDKLIQTELAKIGNLSNLLHSAVPPELTSDLPAEINSDGPFVLKFRVADKGSGTGQAVYRIDGVEIPPRQVGLITSKDTVETIFDLPPGRHTVSATVFDKSNRIESTPLARTVIVKETSQKAALYVVAVGISDYRDHSFDKGVRFAAGDAQMLADRLKQQGTGLFRNVEAVVLRNREATRDNIEKTVQGMAAHVQPADEFVLYLAGHGTALNGEYTFIPWDAIYGGDSDDLQKQSLGGERLQKFLSGIPASKMLLLIDTCSAGAILRGRGEDLSDKGSIERLSKLTGRAILAAANSDQMALEGIENHSVFAYALFDGLRSAADGQGLIQVTTLADRIQALVPEITQRMFHYEQFPQKLIKGDTFPIARKQ